MSLRPAQVGWLARCARAGGQATVLVRRGDELWLVAGAAAPALARGGLRALPAGALLGRWCGGPAGWPWALVLRHAAGKPPTPRGGAL